MGGGWSRWQEGGQAHGLALPCFLGAPGSRLCSPLLSPGHWGHFGPLALECGRCPWPVTLGCVREWWDQDRLLLIVQAQTKDPSPVGPSPEDRDGHTAGPWPWDVCDRTPSLPCDGFVPVREAPTHV